jgi:hypothetical protein
LSMDGEINESVKWNSQISVSEWNPLNKYERLEEGGCRKKSRLKSLVLFGICVFNNCSIFKRWSSFILTTESSMG